MTLHLRLINVLVNFGDFFKKWLKISQNDLRFTFWPFLATFSKIDQKGKANPLTFCRFTQTHTHVHIYTLKMTSIGYWSGWQITKQEDDHLWRMTSLGGWLLILQNSPETKVGLYTNSSRWTRISRSRCHTTNTTGNDVLPEVTTPEF